MSKNKKKRAIFYIGIILIAVSFIACVVSFYLLVFGIPVFSAGAILIFLSNKKSKTKLLITLMPLILYIPSTILFLYAYNYSTPKTILIPKDFNGILRIVYEEKCGSKYDEIGGVKTLIFPKDGILILNEGFDRHVNYNYYLIDKLGNRTKIPQVHALGNQHQKLPCILIAGSGTIGQVTEVDSNQEERGITFSEFYVYNNSIKSSNDKAQQKTDSLTLAMVNQCRQQ